MPDLYRLDENGRTRPLTPLHCRNEEAELQRLLATNLDLLPGDQIRPDDPRRWLLIGREVPVPDPSGGGDRWSVDVLLLDQDATPTFVECKRFRDTRSRREVVGQMLEYAANGPYYWSSERLREYAARTADGRGGDLEEDVRRLDPVSGEAVEDLFVLAEENLREGKLRLVFFMEEAPMELKSIVDFLNRQTERSEILIVEARQYEVDGQRLVHPRLFGYTEEARRAKKGTTVSSASARRRWTEDDFFAEAARQVDEATVNALRTLHDACVRHGYEIRWGTGAQTGSFNPALPLTHKSVISATTLGSVSLNFGGLDTAPEVEAFRDRFAGLVRDRLGWPLDPSALARYPTYRPEDWVPRVDDLAAILGELARS